jgi:dephospho-CoA kinase
MPGRRLQLGLTGGIGSGKSTVAACLAHLGAEVIDTDAIARQITEPGGAAIPALRAEFGEATLDVSGALDRQRMRELVFTDDRAKQRLEAILHPLIGEQTRRRAAQSHADVLVFDVPLLVESGRWRRQVDEVWVVDCHEATQVARVMARSGWTAQAVHAVIARQVSRAHRRSAADLVIYNDGIPRHDLQKLVEDGLRARLA